MAICTRPALTLFPTYKWMSSGTCKSTALSWTAMILGNQVDTFHAVLWCQCILLVSWGYAFLQNIFHLLTHQMKNPTKRVLCTSTGKGEHTSIFRTFATWRARPELKYNSPREGDFGWCGTSHVSISGKIQSPHWSGKRSELIAT